MNHENEQYLLIELAGRPRRLKLLGFTSRRNLHRHYMKHVARVEEANLAESSDPEAWEKLLPPGTLEPDLQARRNKTCQLLKKARPGCKLASKAPTAKPVCAKCRSSEKSAEMKAVDKEFASTVSYYNNLSTSSVLNSIDWNYRPVAPFFASREDGKTKFYTLSPERILVVSGVSPRALKTITAFRLTSGKRLKPLRQAVLRLLSIRRRVMLTDSLVKCRPKSENEAWETSR